MTEGGALIYYLPGPRAFFCPRAPPRLSLSLSLSLSHSLSSENTSGQFMCAGALNTCTQLRWRAWTSGNRCARA